MEGTTAFFRHIVRDGKWILPSRYRAVAWQGGVDLDLTFAAIPPEGAEIELLAVMGIINIKVSLDLRVDIVGDAITWSADEKADRSLTPRTGPIVRISGRAILGKINVQFVGADHVIG